MADTHMFHGDFKSIPDGDVLVHAGDMGRAGDVDELSEVADWLRAQPHRHKIVIAGNHDWLFDSEPAKARALFEGLTYLQDDECVVDGVRFFGTPWTPQFFHWAFMLPRGEPLAARWRLIPRGLDVLVTHGPPLGILDDADMHREGRAVKRPVGCADLRDCVRLVQPRVHLFGHIHGNQGTVDEGGVRYVNCTTDESELPPVVIDL